MDFKIVEWKCRMDIRDLAAGEVDSGTKCPIARALGRRLQPSFEVVVGSDDVWIVYAATGSTIHHQKLPQFAREFTRAFDAGHRPPPISFTLAAPREFLRKNQRAKRRNFLSSEKK
tara:strand:+ start:132 stop:479 length:348 start_codon:yes stop_codon:yes gene_type:complete